MCRGTFATPHIMTTASRVWVVALLLTCLLGMCHSEASQTRDSLSTDSQEAPDPVRCRRHRSPLSAPSRLSCLVLSSLSCVRGCRRRVKLLTSFSPDLLWQKGLNGQERTQTTHLWADRRAKLVPPPPPRAHPRTSTLSSGLNHQESVRDKQHASILHVSRIALGNSSVWKRKPINRRGRANENESTAGSVSTRDNSCQYANDGECDEPSYCPYGTDSSDCGIYV
jgi:hypothetical protein